MKKFLLSIFAVLFAFAGVQAEEVTYTVTSSSAVSSSGNVPSGSSVTYSSTYGTKCQLTGGNSMTLTLSGYAGCKITGIKLSMKSNSSTGAGSFSMKVGDTTLSSISDSKFNTSSWNGAWSTSYVDVTPTMSNADYTIADGENVVITIAATANSLYCQSFTITYEGNGGETPDPETPVTPPAEGDYVIDELTHSWAGITGTNYSDWSGKKATSSAVYAGNSAGGNDAIQLRSNNSNSGIVTTKSGGKAKKIVVEWNSATTSGRTLDVYGKNSAYSAATDLYSASTQGTKLGSIVYGTSTELVIDGDYEYIGLRSNSGAMYLTSISISWDASNVVVVPDAPMLPTSGDFVTLKNIEITNFNDYENGTTVYYSINGGEPMVYTAAFDITTTCEIVAYAEQDGKKSAEVRAEYTRIAKDPVINIVGDTNPDAFEGSIEVEIETENGAVAYYTLNGEDPTVGSTECEGNLTIKATATLKVIAVEEGEYRSKNVVDKAFTMALNDTSVDVDANSVTFDASEQNYENGAAITSVTIVEGITATFDKGSNSNSPKYYTSGYAIRCYGGNNFTIESTVGTIIKIVLTYGSGDGSNAITTDCGEFNSDTWVGNAESVKFTIGGTSGNRRIQKITVTYGEPKNENYSLEVTSAGWATLFLDYAVAIPEGVTCYTVSAVSAESATLVNVEDVLPANTAVIVEAEEGECVFEVTDASTEVESNMLGTTVNKYIFEDAYVLGVVDGVVGLYKAEMAGGAWLNNANKAYLPASAVPNKSAAFYGFDWNGTTGIDEITDNREQSTVIYDLTGRRVETITEPGIYIVNGKKVLVK